jgi:hypothetical protein
VSAMSSLALRPLRGLRSKAFNRKVREDRRER